MFSGLTFVKPFLFFFSFSFVIPLLVSIDTYQNIISLVKIVKEKFEIVRKVLIINVQQYIFIYLNLNFKFLKLNLLNLNLF